MYDKSTPCYCGSGKPFAECHGNLASISPEKIASIRVNEERKLAVAVSKDFLLKQLQRDGPVIAKSFDSHAIVDLTAASELIAYTVDLLVPHYMSKEIDGTSYEATCSQLLGYAVTTFLASVEIARHGYRRQYGATVRGVVEALSTILRISIEPGALEQFHEGKLKSTRSISVATRAFPPLGPLYGLLSNHFVHISAGHARFEPTMEYTPSDSALPFIRANMRGVSLLIYIVAELVLYRHVTKPRYWRPKNGGLSFEPSDAEKKWMAEYLDQN
jgi:hypothetical protein